LPYCGFDQVQGKTKKQKNSQACITQLSRCGEAVSPVSLSALSGSREATLNHEDWQLAGKYTGAVISQSAILKLVFASCLEVPRRTEWFSII
jgi:hypothetical protein